MHVVDGLKKVLHEFRQNSRDARELSRLEQFFNRMKEAGIAKARGYDIPLPDTIGRKQAARLTQSALAGFNNVAPT